MSQVSEILKQIEAGVPFVLQNGNQRLRLKLKCLNQKRVN